MLLRILWKSHKVTVEGHGITSSLAAWSRGHDQFLGGHRWWADPSHWYSTYWNDHPVTVHSDTHHKLESCTNYYQSISTQGISCISLIVVLCYASHNFLFLPSSVVSSSKQAAIQHQRHVLYHGQVLYYATHKYHILPYCQQTDVLIPRLCSLHHEARMYSSQSLLLVVLHNAPIYSPVGFSFPT